MRMKKPTLFLTALLLCISVQAQAKKNTSIQASGVRDAIIKIKSPNPSEVLDAVMILGASRNTAATRPLMDLLSSGPRDDITNAAIDALGSLGDSASLDILLDYLNHRRSDVRERVILAVMDMQDARIDGALEAALRDSDPGVRNAAAMAIGNRGQTGSIPILFQAFERGVNEAAIAIGRIGDAKAAERLSTFLGRRDLIDVLPGLDEFLRRKDFADKGKLDILEQLFELAGPEVKRFLIAYASTFSEEQKRNKVKLKAEEIIRAIPDE